MNTEAPPNKSSAPSSAAATEADVTTRVAEEARQRLAIITPIAAVAYLATAGSHIVALPRRALIVMIPLALASALTFFAVSRCVAPGRTPKRRNLLLVCTATYLAVIIHSLVRLHYSHEAMDMMFISALVVAVGLIPSPIRLHIAMVSLYSAGWAATLFSLEGGKTVAQFIVPLTLINALSIAIRQMQLFTAARLHALRTHDAKQNKQLELQSAQLQGTIATLERAQAQVIHSERLAAIGSLAAGVAHEVNNPATYVLAHLDDVRTETGGIVAPDCTRKLDESIEGVRQIVAIVKELSQFARQDAEPYQALDVDQLIASALRIGSGHTRHTLAVHKSNHAKLGIWGDPGQLGQVLLNLVINAAQAMTGRRRENNRLDISARDAGGQVIIEVKDNGPGMSPERTKKIFEPFFTTKARGVGTGLGLSVARDIVERHKGTIEVESQLDIGTSFTITLPGIAMLKSVAPPAPASEPVRESVRARVLLVDDNALVLQVHARMLRKRFEVDVANSPSAALARLEAGTHYDAVVCDLMMPDIDGLTLRDRVLSFAAHLACRFVFVSGGVADVDMRARLVNEGLRYMTKPFSKSDLIDAVDRAIAVEQERVAS